MMSFTDGKQKLRGTPEARNERHQVSRQCPYHVARPQAADSEHTKYAVADSRQRVVLQPEIRLTTSHRKKTARKSLCHAGRQT
jgi:hypothetical protein